MLSKLIVPLIVLMSCLIAYLGDYLGRLLGKKRLTFLGLRPKHTAILITVVTGMLIATATLGSVMAVDRDVRKALWEFSQVKEELDQAKQDSSQWQKRASRDRQQAVSDEMALNSTRQRLESARSQEREARASQRAAEARLTQVGTRLDQETRSLRELALRKAQLDIENGQLRQVNRTEREKFASLAYLQKVQLSAATVRLARMQREESQLRASSFRLQGQKSTLERDVIHKEHERNAIAKQRDRLKSEMALLSSQKQALQTRFDDTLTKYDSARTQLAEADRKMNDEIRQYSVLELQKEKLSGVNLKLAADNMVLQSTNDNLEQANRDARASLMDAQRLRDQAIQAADQATIVASNSFAQWRDSTHKQIIFEPDQLISQALVRGDVNPDEVRQLVNNALVGAEDAASLAGAGDPDGTGHKLRLMDPSNPLRSHDQVLEDLLTNLRQKPGYMVLRIQALRRFFAGEQVTAAAYLVPNKLVYARGQVVGVSELDGRQPERALRNRVFDLLTQEIGARARQDGLLPDSNNQVSTDMLDKVLDLSRAIHELHKPVTVQVMAAQDTWCSQPLDLVFRVVSAA